MSLLLQMGNNFCQPSVKINSKITFTNKYHIQQHLSLQPNKCFKQFLIKTVSARVALVGLSTKTSKPISHKGILCMRINQLSSWCMEPQWRVYYPKLLLRKASNQEVMQMEEIKWSAQISQLLTRKTKDKTCWLQLVLNLLQVGLEQAFSLYQTQRISSMNLGQTSTDRQSKSLTLKTFMSLILINQLYLDNN